MIAQCVRSGVGVATAMMVAATLLTAAPSSAQDHTVTGRVTSNELAPLSGVTVSVEGSTVGTITGANGAYTIAAPSSNSTLVFSSLGYASQTIPIDGRSTINVQLEVTAFSLDEVLVVGYGTQRRGDLTGSVSAVSAEDLEQTPTGSVVQALQGASPGLNIQQHQSGAETRMNINIRGQNSLLASTDPLVVVDGLPYNGPLSEINQSDIESLTILKDASSVAIYGARGANGVVLITTKMGDGAPQFAYDGYVGMQQAAEIPELMNANQYAEFKCTRLNGGTLGNCDQHLYPSEVTNWAAGVDTDWLDLALRTGSQQQHNFSVSGGDAGTRYYINGSALTVAGVAENDDFDRYTLRVNLDQDVRSWLRAGTATQLGWTDRTGLPARFGSGEAWLGASTAQFQFVDAVGFVDGSKDAAFHMSPLQPAFNEDGTPRVSPVPEDPWFHNPLQPLYADNSDVTRRVLTNNFLEAQLPLEGLTFRLSGGIDFSQQAQATFFGMDTGYGADRNGQSRTTDRNIYDWTVENLLSFNRTAGVHTLDLTGLYSFSQNKHEARNVIAQGFPSDQLSFWQANLAQQVVPGYIYREEALVSQMGRVNYGFDGRYLATFTVRRDGSSVFGANNKYGVFPSVALAWNLAAENFMPFASAISELKLRASWGVNGNSAIRPYQTLSRLDGQPYVLGTSPRPGFILGAMANPDLKWESTETVNLGVDFGAIDNRLNGSVDIYKGTTSDLLLSRQIPSTHGVGRITSNLGVVENRGVELALMTENIRTNEFGWSSVLNVSANRNEIVDLYGDQTDDVGNQWFIGQPIDVEYGLDMDGIWQVGDDIANSAQPNARPGDVRAVDANGDGEISNADRVIRATGEPSWTAGMTNTFRYGNVSLSGVLYTVQGLHKENIMVDGDLSWLAELRRNIPVQPFWTPENPLPDRAANRLNTNPLGIDYMRDASFVRLRDVTLSITMPSSVNERLGTSAFSIYASGRNLHTWTDWVGLDPEVTNQLEVPLERTLVTGVNVSF